MLGCIGAILLFFYLLRNLIGNEKINVMLHRLDSASDGWMIAVGIGITLAAVIISFLISCRIMEKKEL